MNTTLPATGRARPNFVGQFLKTRFFNRNRWASRRPASLLLVLSALVSNAAIAAETRYLAPAIGERKVAAILVNFLDKPGQPGTAESARSVFDGPINNYFQEASYQAMWLSTEVFGWWTLPLMSSRCDDTAAGLVSSEILQEAERRGVDLSGYDHLVYVFNEAYGGMCSGAVGTVSPGKQGRIWRSWEGNTGTAELAFDGAKGIESTIHELGHNLGLWHANLLNCGAQIATGECSTSHYGDVYDAMGSGPVGPHFNAFHKERLGWIQSDHGSANRIEPVAENGIFAIAPYSEEGGTKALKIRRGPGSDGGTDYFYLEYRQPFGWDEGFRPQAYQGLLVRLGNDTVADSSRLLDMTPDEPFDHALLPGSVFHDPLSQVDIELLEAGPSGALVSVTLGIDLTPPVITATTPADNAVLEKGSTINLVARVTDESGLAAVSFHIDGNLYCQAQPSGEPDEFSCSFDVPKGRSRSLLIEARALDAMNNESRTAVTVTTGDASSGDTGGSGKKGGGRKK